MKTSVWSIRLLAVTACAMLVGGCAERTTGRPQTVGSPSAPPTGPSPTSGRPLANIDPCKLVKKSEGAQFGITGIERKDQFGVRGCRYKAPTGFQILMLDTVGLAQAHNDIADGPPTKTTVDGHPALFQLEQGSGCSISISYTENSYFDIEGADTGSNRDKACKVAQQAAPIVVKNVFSGN